MIRKLLALAATALAAAAVGATALVHPAAPLAVVVGVILVGWVLASPYRALMGFMLVLMLRPTDLVPALAALQPAKMLALASLGLWTLDRLLRRDTTWPANPLDRHMIGLTVASLISAKLSFIPGDSMTFFQEVFVKVVILYVLMIALINTPARLLSTVQAIAGACTFLGGYALWAKATGTSQIEGSRSAFVGLLGDPNDLALVLLMSFPFLASAVMATKGGQRWRYGLLLAVVIGGIVSTQSRGGFLGMGAAGWILLGDRVKSRAIQVMVVVIGLGGLVAMSGMSKRSSGGADSDGIDESAQGRLDSWYAGFRMLKRRPLFGVGLAAFADVYPNFAADTVFWEKHEAHNTFVKAFSEVGLVGFIPFMGLVIHSFKSAKRARERRDAIADPLERAAAGALLPTLAGFFTSAFFLSQCWGWFTFILFALAGAAQAIAAALPDPPAAPQGATA